MESYVPSAVPEIAIAITGFTAVATVIAFRDGYKWDPSDRMRIWVLVRTSIIVLFGSFIPELVSKLQESEAATWSISSGVLSVVIFADVVWTFTRPNMPPHFAHRFLGVVALVLVLVLAASSLGYLGATNFTFLLTLLFLLAVALYNFVELLMLRIVSSDD